MTALTSPSPYPHAHTGQCCPAKQIYAIQVNKLDVSTPQAELTLSLGDTDPWLAATEEGPDVSTSSPLTIGGESFLRSTWKF